MAAGVSRRKRTFEDFEEPEQALQPDVKKQRCSSPWSSRKGSLPSGIPSSLSNGVAGSWIPSGTCDDSDLDATILDFSDGESPDSPFSISLEDEDKLLADDPETDSSNSVLGFTVEDDDSGFAAVAFRGSPLQSVPRDLDTSPEPLPPNGLSIHPSCSLPHSSSPANPEGGSDVRVGSPNQTERPLSSDRLQGAVPIETGGFSLNKGNSGSLGKEANQTGGEESPAVSHLMAEHEFASVATDRPSEGQAFIAQREEGGESTSNPSCEIRGESDFASEIATEHSITAQNEDHVEDPSPEEPEDTSPDDSRRRLIFIPEGHLQSRGDRYLEGVLTHLQHPHHPIGKPEAKSQRMASKAICQLKKKAGQLRKRLLCFFHFVSAGACCDQKALLSPGAVNELSALMRLVASEYHPQESSYDHPTDLTVRNYAQRANIEIQKCNLGQWVNQNQRHLRRFAHIPDKFERSPIPSH